MYIPIRVCLSGLYTPVLAPPPKTWYICMKNRLLMNKQLISFQNQRQPVSKTSSPTVDLGEMVLISRKKNAHNIGTFTWEIWCLKYTIVGSTPRFAYLGKFTSYMVFIYGLPWWLRWERIGLQCGRPGFSSWVGDIPDVCVFYSFFSFIIS